VVKVLKDVYAVIDCLAKESWASLADVRSVRDI